MADANFIIKQRKFLTLRWPWGVKSDPRSNIFEYLLTGFISFIGINSNPRPSCPRYIGS